MFDYSLYFIITLGVSTLFGVIGLGSSLILIPFFTFVGIEFNLAKAMGVFINGITTLSLTFQNIKNRLINYKEILPLVVVSSVFAFFGAYGSIYVEEVFAKILFVFFIFFSLLLLFVGHVQFRNDNYKNNLLSIVVFIALIAFIGGLIGVGGGAVYLPMFLYIGIKTKRSIAMTSALIPIVSFSAFFGYFSFVEVDWLILFDVSIASLLGAFFANRIMKYIKNDKHLKIFISILLVSIAIYMVYAQILGDLYGK